MAAGCFHVLPLHRVTHVRYGQPVCRQTLRIDEDADLARLASGDVHFAHAVHGLDGAAHLLVGNFGELAPAHRPCHKHGEDGVGIWIQLANHRRKDVGREAVKRAGHFFPNILGRALDIALQHKRADEAGNAFRRVHGHLVEPVHRGDGILERQYDARGHFLGAGPGEFDSDVNGGGISAGEQIDAQRAVRENAQRHQEGDEHNRKHGARDADVGKFHRLAASFQFSVLRCRLSVHVCQFLPSILSFRFRSAWALVTRLATPPGQRRRRTTGPGRPPPPAHRHATLRGLPCAGFAVFQA